jgi:ribosomal protein L14E/L6E/L27E
LSDPDTRDRRAKKFKHRNPVAKIMNENKGAFAIKIPNPKKSTYKREKLRARDIEIGEEEWSEE